MSINRNVKILNILIKQNQKAITGNALAGMLNVFNKTVRNDIEGLNKLLIKNGSEIISKTGVGGGYVLKIQNIKKFKKFKNENASEKETFYPQQRISYMILCILCAKENVIIASLANKLYISKEQAYKDLNIVKDILKEKDIVLINKSKLGILAKGIEFNKRIVIAEVLQEHPFLKKYFYHFNEYETKKMLRKFIIENNINVAQAIINPLIQQMLVILQRVMDGFNIERNEGVYGIQTSYSMYENAIKIATLFAKNYSIILDKYEIGQISSLLEGVNLSSVSSGYLEGMAFAVDHLLQLIYDTYSLDLRGDLKLRKDLSTHIYRMFLKMDYDMQFEYNIDKKIVSNFPFSYELARFTMLHLTVNSSYVGLNNEIILLTMHYQLALERIFNKQSKVLLIVDADGRGAINYICHEFKESFSAYISELKVLPSYKAVATDKSYYDHVFYLDTNDQNELFEPFSSRGRMKILSELKGLALKKEQLLKVLPETHFVFEKKGTMEQLKRKVYQVLNMEGLQKEIDYKNNFANINENPYVHLDIEVNRTSETQIWVGVNNCEKKDHKNVYLLCLQAQNGIVTDRAIYNMCVNIKLHYYYLIEIGAFDNYQNLIEYLLRNCLD